jgi:hypothetical protein
MSKRRPKCTGVCVTLPIREPHDFEGILRDLLIFGNVLIRERPKR